MESKLNSLVIALTGGIGSGKSTVSALIENYGFRVINTDNIARDLMNSDKDLIRDLKSEFGNNIYDESETLNSSLLASLVFGIDDQSKDNLNRLNRIVHPKVIEEMIKQVELLEKQNEKLIFVESALVFEAGLDEGFDYIVTVYSDDDKVVERLSGSKKMSVENARLRLANQICPKEKAAMSDFVIENNSSLEELRKSVDFILGVLKSL